MLSMISSILIILEIIPRILLDTIPWMINELLFVQQKSEAFFTSYLSGLSGKINQ